MSLSVIDWLGNLTSECPTSKREQVRTCITAQAKCPNYSVHREGVQPDGMVHL